MPEISVWPVSGSVWTRKVGSSCISLPSARPSFSWSTLVLGSIDTADHRLREVHRLEHDRRVLGSQIVSPVVTFLSPTAAAMSPAQTSVDLLALVGVHLEEAADALGLAAASR